MYPWAPVFGRGYVLLAHPRDGVARPLPLDAARRRRHGRPARRPAPPGPEHAPHRCGRDGPVPPLLAAAALAGHGGGGGVRRGHRPGEVVVGRGGRRRRGLPRGARLRLVLALAGERRRRPGARRHAGADAAPAARPAAGWRLTGRRRPRRRCVGGVRRQLGADRVARGAGRAVPRPAGVPDGRDDARARSRSSATSTARRRSSSRRPTGRSSSSAWPGCGRPRCPRRAPARFRGSTRASETTWGRRSSRRNRRMPAGSRCCGSWASTTSSSTCATSRPTRSRLDPARPRARARLPRPGGRLVAPGAVRHPARRATVRVTPAGAGGRSGPARAR